MQEALSRYTKHLRDRYADYWPPSLRRTMVKTFKTKWFKGRKYARLIVWGQPNRPKVHSYITLVDTPKFPRGTILKPGSHRSPVKNFSRGNVLDGSFQHIDWVGI
jgi:hypothetical protein